MMLIRNYSRRSIVDVGPRKSYRGEDVVRMWCAFTCTAAYRWHIAASVGWREYRSRAASDYESYQPPERGAPYRSSLWCCRHGGRPAPLI